jgi:hypothetical protein
LGFFLSPQTITKYIHKYSSFDLRWLSYATFSWTADFGLDIFWLKLGNVLLRAANATALFPLSQRLFQVTLTESSSMALLTSIGNFVAAQENFTKSRAMGLCPQN